MRRYAIKIEMVEGENVFTPNALGYYETLENFVVIYGGKNVMFSHKNIKKVEIMPGKETSGLEDNNVLSKSKTQYTLTLSINKEGVLDGEKKVIKNALDHYTYNELFTVIADDGRFQVPVSSLRWVMEGELGQLSDAENNSDLPFKPNSTNFI